MALRLLLGYGGGARCLYGRGGEEEALHRKKAQQGRLPPAPRKGKVGSTSAVVSPYVRWGEAGGMSPIPREKRVFLRGLPVHRVHGSTGKGYPTAIRLVYCQEVLWVPLYQISGKNTTRAFGG